MAQPPIKKGAIDTGTGADQIVALDGSGNMPAVDGSAILNLNASELNSGSINDARIPQSAVTQHEAALSIASTQITGSIDADTLSGQSLGTGANDIVQLNGSAQLPAVDGSLLTGVNPEQPKFNSYLTATKAMTNTVLKWNTANFTLSQDSGNGTSGFNATTGDFTPTEAGYYYIGYHLQTESLGSINSINVSIYKNAVLEAQLITPVNENGSSFSVGNGCIVYLDGNTDYAYCTIGSADTAWSLSGVAGGSRTRIFGFRVL